MSVVDIIRTTDAAAIPANLSPAPATGNGAPNRQAFARSLKKAERAGASKAAPALDNVGAEQPANTVEPNANQPSRTAVVRKKSPPGDAQPKVETSKTAAPEEPVDETQVPEEQLLAPAPAAAVEAPLEIPAGLDQLLEQLGQTVVIVSDETACAPMGESTLALPPGLAQHLVAKQTPLTKPIAATFEASVTAIVETHSIEISAAPQNFVETSITTEPLQIDAIAPVTLPVEADVVANTINIAEPPVEVPHAIQKPLDAHKQDKTQEHTAQPARNDVELQPKLVKPEAPTVAVAAPEPRVEKSKEGRGTADETKPVRAASSAVPDQLVPTIDFAPDLEIDVPEIQPNAASIVDADATASTEETATIEREAPHVHLDVEQTEAKPLLDSPHASRHQPVARGTHATGRLHVEHAEFVDRLSNAVRSAFDQGRELKVRLNPPELGALQIEVTSRDGMLTATLRTQTAAAHSIIRENMSQLHDALVQHGATIERIDVQLSTNLSEEWQSPTDDGRQQEREQHEFGDRGNQRRDEPTQEHSEGASSPTQRTRRRADRLDIEV